MPKTIKLPRKTFPKLYKACDDKVMEWAIWVEPEKDETATIYVEYGYTGGTPQRKGDHVTEGKNLGKKNATTPYEQAVLEAEAKWKKQLERKGYGRNAEQSAGIRAVSPMLAKDFAEYGNAIDWGTAYGQPKLDGFRLLASKVNGKIILKSRENKLITTMDHLVEQLEAGMAEGQILDGEMYIHGVTFQRLASIIKRKQEQTEQVRYNIYDMVSTEPFVARHGILKEILSNGFDHLDLVKTVKIRSRDDLQTFQASCIEDGYEGAMLRHSKLGYDAGKRSQLLLKVKTFKDGEFEVVDVKDGRGSAKGMAIFICKAEGGYFDVLAPGTHEDKRRYWQDCEKARLSGKPESGWIGKMLTVKYQELTTGDEPVPRFPVAIRFRDE